jgi:hypothetical protein
LYTVNTIKRATQSLQEASKNVNMEMNVMYLTLSCRKKLTKIPAFISFAIISYFKVFSLKAGLHSRRVASV